MKKGVIFGILAAVGGLILLWAKGSSLSNMISKLEISPKLNGKPQLRTGSGNFFSKLLNVATGSAYLRVPIAVDFKNRTDQQVKIGVSSVMAYIKNTLVAATEPGDTSVTIKANATSTLEGLNLDIPTTKLISVLGKAVDSLISSGNFDTILKDLKVQIGATLNDAVQFDVTIDLGGKGSVDTGAKVSISGLGLVAAKKRNIRPISDYIAYIPNRNALNYADNIVKLNGTVDDTLDLMQQSAAKDKNNVAELARHLQKESLPETLKSIFDFVYSHIQYELDSRFTEQVRRPLRTLYDQKGDCDCYATLIGSMLAALNIPYRFRVAAYEAGVWQHVYVIVPTPQGYYVVDPVLDKCFEEKIPSKYFDR